MSAPYNTLLIRLDGPMQAWGTDSKFGIRETRVEPSKSGVVGLVAAALGRPRHADVGDLATLRFGVRADREGRLRRDFHTAGKSGFYRASGKVERTDVIVSNRYYLADAIFTAGLESGDEAGHALLQEMHAALLNPHWPLFLGRRAFPPASPVGHEQGIVPMPLAEALQKAALSRRADQSADGRYRCVLDADVFDAGLPEDAARTLAGPDHPLSFTRRQFATRQVITARLPLADAG